MRIIYSFSFQQLEIHRARLVGDFPLISEDESQLVGSSLIKRICHRHPYKKIRLIGCLRMKCVLDCSWRNLVHYDQALTRIHNADQFCKQGNFKGSIMSELEMPMHDLECSCGWKTLLSFKMKLMVYNLIVWTLWNLIYLSSHSHGMYLLFDSERTVRLVKITLYNLYFHPIYNIFLNTLWLRVTNKFSKMKSSLNK